MWKDKLGVSTPVMLAPMAGVTDLPFRKLCRRMGCDMTFTEMVSAKGLRYDNTRTVQLLETDAQDRPCGVQLFGSDPQIMADMAKRLVERYAEDILLIDINMGCPAHKIVSNGEGSALMKNLPLAAEIIDRVSRSVPIPVTVKFRKGWDDTSVNAVEFARMAEESGAQSICLHGRTREQGYSGKADWDIIGTVKAAVSIPVIGNGDVFSGESALCMLRDTGCDGILVARGAQGNPFLFSEIKSALRGERYAPPGLDARIDLAIEHLHMAVAYKGKRGVVEMRKHLAWYLHGFPGAAAMRVRINGMARAEEMEEALLAYKQLKQRMGKP